MDLPELFEINGDHRLITTEDGSPAMADGDYLMVHSNTDNTVYKVRAQAQVMDFFNLKVVSSCDDSICTASPSPASPCSDDADSLSGFRWKDGAIKALVAAYKEKEPQMSSGKTSCKKVWEMIAGMLNDTGHEVTGPQCKTKMASLKKTYKSIKDHNNKSGNDRRSWPYFEMLEDVFGGKPWVAPLSTVSSSGSSSSSGPSSSSGLSVPSSAAASVATGEPPQKRFKNCTSNELLTVLKNNAEERRKMHDDLLKRQDAYLALMQDLVKQNKQ